MINAIVTPSGEVYEDSEYTNSHEVLARALSIKDFIRVQLLPSRGIHSWELRVKESEIPDWWDGVRNYVIERLQSRAQQMIVTDYREILLGGCWILTGLACVEQIQSCRILAINGLVTVGKILGSSRVSEISGRARVSEIGNQTIVNRICGSACVNKVCDSVRVNLISDCAEVHIVDGSAEIDELGGSAIVQRLNDNAKINKITGQAIVLEENRRAY